MTPASVVVAVVLLAGVAVNAAVRWGDRRACRFANETEEGES